MNYIWVCTKCMPRESIRIIFLPSLPDCILFLFIDRSASKLVLVTSDGDDQEADPIIWGRSINAVPSYHWKRRAIIDLINSAKDKQIKEKNNDRIVIFLIAVITDWLDSITTFILIDFIWWSSAVSLILFEISNRKCSFMAIQIIFLMHLHNLLLV